MRVARLEDVLRLDPGTVGGKATGLARLAALGLPIPPAFVLPTEVHARWRLREYLEESDWRGLTEAVTPTSCVAGQPGVNGRAAYACCMIDRYAP